MFTYVLKCLGYDPVPEQIIFKESICKVEIFEKKIIVVPGLYRRDEKKVYLCEPLLRKIVRESISKKISNRSELELYLIYRELVRLHEHIHAFIDQKVGELKVGRWDNHRDKSVKYVEEPITEFLSYCVIKYMINKDPYYQVALNVFEQKPRVYPYDLWRNIKDKVDGTYGNITDNLAGNLKLLKIIFNIFINIMRAKPRGFKEIFDGICQELFVLSIF